MASLTTRELKVSDLYSCDILFSDHRRNKKDVTQNKWPVTELPYLQQIKRRSETVNANPVRWIKYAHSKLYALIVL